MSGPRHSLLLPSGHVSTNCQNQLAREERPQRIADITRRLSIPGSPPGETARRNRLAIARPVSAWTLRFQRLFICLYSVRKSDSRYKILPISLLESALGLRGRGPTRIDHQSCIDHVGLSSAAISSDANIIRTKHTLSQNRECHRTLDGKRRLERLTATVAATTTCHRSF